jgi:hypothetical protein
MDAWQRELDYLLIERNLDERSKLDPHIYNITVNFFGIGYFSLFFL